MDILSIVNTILIVSITALVVTVLQNYDLSTLFPKTTKRTKRKKHNPHVDRELEQKLKEMLYGDTAAAKRLLRATVRNHPGRSNEWYLEKVLWDLERDRYR